MRMFNALVFDDRVTVTGNSTTLSATFWPGTELEELLGQCDQLAYQLNLDNVTYNSTGNPTASLSGWSSIDGRNYVVKNASLEIPVTNLTTGENVLVGMDNGARPSYRLFRPIVTLTAAGVGFTVSGRVRLFVTGRDHGGVLVHKANAGSGYHRLVRPAPPPPNCGPFIQDCVKRTKHSWADCERAVTALRLSAPPPGGKPLPGSCVYGGKIYEGI